MCTALGHAQERNLFREQRERNEQNRMQEVRTRLHGDNQRLVNGLARAVSRMGQIDYSTAKCSDGWQNFDYQNQVEQICNSQGCFGMYARRASDYSGSIFTCHFNLTNKWQCF